MSEVSQVGTLTRREYRRQQQLEADPWAGDRDVQKHDAHDRWAQIPWASDFPA